MVTPNQNQVFSPKLKRPEGTCSPVTRPPALLIHRASMFCQTLSRAQMTIIASIDAANSGPMKLCTFLPSTIR